MADILNKIKIGVSPLTKRIQIYRMGKSPTDALESKDFTGEVYGAVIEHMMDGAPEGKGMTATIRSGELAWDVTVRPTPTEEEKTAKTAAQSKREGDEFFGKVLVQLMDLNGVTDSPTVVTRGGEDWVLTLTKAVNEQI